MSFLKYCNMQFIMALFGYCKIPKNVIQLSLKQENNINTLIMFFKKLEHSQLNERFDTMLKSQKAITQFLQSGRLLV